MRNTILRIAVLITMAIPLAAAMPFAELSAAGPESILRSACQDCHADGADEGGFELPESGADWSLSENLETLEKIEQLVSRGIMPPADADPLEPEQRQTLLHWIDQRLVRDSPIGGTRLRRLSGREFRNTVASVFGLADYQLPIGFPPDAGDGGFDNQADALVMAASHLEAFSNAATEIADGFFPPAKRAAESRRFEIPPQDLVISYSSACLIDGAMRLASSGDNDVRNATWPTKFEAPTSGVYRVQITARSLDPRGGEHTPELLVASTACTGREIVSQQTMEIPVGKPVTSEFEIGIDAGGTFRLRYANGPFNYDQKPELAAFLTTLFREEPKLAAAWEKVGKPARGGSGWQRLKEAMGDAELETSPFVEQGDRLSKLVKQVSSNSVSSGETLVYKYFEEGPYVAIEAVTVEGPIRGFSDSAQRKLESQRARFLGESEGKGDIQSLAVFFRGFLTSLFRRPATDSEVDAYVGLVRRELESNGSLDRGLHLAIRTAMISPSFLYRCAGSGELSEYDLASRLSYFLTSGPPDETLMGLATDGKLSRSKVLRSQARRLLKNSRVFAEDFTTQWLDLATLDQLMPDTRLIARFTADHRKGMKEEVVLSFREILDSDLPIRTFVAPDFVFTNEAVGRDIYQLPQFSGKKNKKGAKAKTLRLDVDPEGRIGGLLTMPAVMMATANGVDTQPVLRGVWMLENVLGTPPPEPPKAVPALTPDTSGVSSPREKLQAHMADASCAACHREIDPLGFVLENLDPIGRWRDHYPRYVEKNGKQRRTDGAPIDASGVLPSGEPLQDVNDLKKWLAGNPSPLARCLGEKLLQYATGRELNYRERKIVSDLVEQNRDNNLAFQSFLLDLIDSEVFRSR